MHLYQAYGTFFYQILALFKRPNITVRRIDRSTGHLQEAEHYCQGVQCKKKKQNKKNLDENV